MRKFSAALAFLTIGCMAPTANAYLPPAQFIIKNMITKRSGVRIVRVSSIVLAPVFNGGTRGTGAHFKAVTIYDAAKRLMHSQAFDANGTLLYAVQKKAEELPLTLQILYDPYDADIVQSLQRAKIPTHSDEPDGDNVIALERWNGSIAWALGAVAVPANAPTSTTASGSAMAVAATKVDGPQLWIEKDSFLPVRIITGDQDIQFTNYRFSQELPYPRTTTLANRAGVEQVEENIQSFQINPSATAIRAAWITPTEQGAIQADGFTAAGEASLLKDLIRTYYAGIR